jgi:hypothetical protein
MLGKKDKLEKRIYLTCPVNSARDEEKEFLNEYVNELEKKGVGVYYPKRDTEQFGDFIGKRICSDNRGGIFNSNEVHKYISPTSIGSLFDDGMTFMARKPMRIINPEKLSETQKNVQSFVNGYCLNNPDERYDLMLERRDEIKRSGVVEYQFWGKTPEFLFDFGMTFMARKPILLLNKEKIIPTEHKSFENILLDLNGKINY